MSKSYGKIRWVEDLKEVPQKAEFIVLKTEHFFIELQYQDQTGLRWVLAQTSLEAMNQSNYERTLTEFRKIVQCRKTIWVVMPTWKYFKIHPELDIGFDWFQHLIQKYWIQWFLLYSVFFIHILLYILILQNPSKKFYYIFSLFQYFCIK